MCWKIDGKLELTVCRIAQVETAVTGVEVSAILTPDKGKDLRGSRSGTELPADDQRAADAALADGCSTIKAADTAVTVGDGLDRAVKVIAGRRWRSQTG